MEKLPIYAKPVLGLESLVEALKASNSRIILVTGFSLRSSEKMEALYVLLKNKLSSDLEIILRKHPRRVNRHLVDPEQNDIVLACITTQYAINRYLKNNSTVNFHIVTNEDLIWDPAPYLNIPLIVERKPCI